MRPLGSFGRILLHRLPVDGRKQINGLAQIVKDSMSEDPYGEGLFVFTSKQRDVVKLLYWDRTGFALWIKRLEKDKFQWPIRLEGTTVHLSAKELGWLLDGIDILKSRPHQTLHYSSL